MNHVYRAKVRLHSFLTCALNGGEWSALCPGKFTPGQTTTGKILVGDCVGYGASLDILDTRKV
jgi:hypothetical protein